MARYFTNQGIENLRKYKPHGAVDYSVTLRFILSHFYNFLAAFIPISIAPNVVTLTGTIAIFIAHLLVVAYSPSLSENLPRWLYFFAGFAVFSYQTLDNLDGKHAKRTGAGSPLGHLFDHGCDALACTIVGVLVCGVLKAQLSVDALSFLHFGGFLQGYLATWEELHTGAMTLGYINGPVEGLLLIQFLCLAAAVYGGNVWNSRACDCFFPFPQYCPFPSWNLVDFLFYFEVSSSAIMCVLHIRNGLTVACKQGQGFVAFKRLLPLAVILFSSYYCLLMSPSDIVTHHGILYFWTIGITFAFLITTMMMHHLSSEFFSPYNITSVLWIAMSINTTLLRYQPQLGFNEVGMLILVAIIAFSKYIHLVWAAISDFRQQLGIPCLTIPKSKRKI